MGPCLLKSVKSFNFILQVFMFGMLQEEFERNVNSCKPKCFYMVCYQLTPTLNSLKIQEMRQSYVNSMTDTVPNINNNHMVKAEAMIATHSHLVYIQ